MTEERDFGPQPLATLLEGWGLSNHNLVEASPEQLTHKQVQRACQGRKLTLKMKQKLARTLNFGVWGRLTDKEREGFTEYFPKHLFNYSKGFDADAPDINVDVMVNLAERNLRRDFKQELGIE
ncbi:hypothetical protein N9B63_02245 [Akkermansiaceae bacterium]|jgi:hypothetical protein|nr:hypothetical protein [Akkermansiaceae bacterium]MDA8976359.1 hypothetical protein [bacterium]MDB4383035.1 hypothetical protein [Akkermansiaceae bacterium]MDB4461725.1 hypothetical protein [bacterium]